MTLRCAFREVHGRCEPELLARDEADKLRSALYDTVVGKPCRVGVWGAIACAHPAVGVIEASEVGWLPACEMHMDDNDVDGCIRLRAKVAY